MEDYWSTLLGCCVVVQKVHRYSHRYTYRTLSDHHSQLLSIAFVTSTTNPSTVPSNTPLKPKRDANAQDTMLDCTLKYKPRNPIGKLLRQKSSSLCTIQYKPHKTLIGKTWEKSSKENHKLTTIFV
jgi:hypothetical protein